MSETNTPVTEAVESTTESTPSSEAETTERLDTARTEPEGDAPPSSDPYEDKIEALIREKQAAEKGEEAERESLRKGESWNDIYKRQDPEVQRAMQSMRKDYTHKTQDLSKQRKEAKSELEKAHALQKTLYESDAYKNLSKIAEESGEEFDPFDPDSFKKYVEKAVASRLKSVLEPMHAEQQKKQAQANLQRFVEDHPELKSDEGFKKEVRDLLINDSNLKLEQAYWIVQGKKSREMNRQDQRKQDNQRRAAKAAGLRIGSGKRSGMTAPPETKGMKAADIYDYLLSQQK